uniref:Uncharacterized protein n=1 Tax=Rhizochromulina marina TaxID=1034831 RepID=A0A7S2W605_9STRA
MMHLSNSRARDSLAHYSKNLPCRLLQVMNKKAREVQHDVASMGSRSLSALRPTLVLPFSRSDPVVITVDHLSLGPWQGSLPQEYCCPTLDCKPPCRDRQAP